MAMAATITYVAKVGSQLRVGFKVAASGNYVTGGDTLNLATAGQDPLFAGIVADVIASQGPTNLDVWSEGGNLANHYYAIPGTTPANNKVKIDSAFNTELSAGAYPAGVTGDTIVGEASFNYGL